MRIHLERRPQLVGGTGEFRQHEHAAVVRARGDVLFRDEVHPIPQRGHEHDVGGEEQGDHFLARISLMQIADRAVAERVVVAVDAGDRQLDLVAQLDVGLDTLAAGARDLHEGDVVDGDAPVFEELAERLQAVADALGVVQSVDAEEDRLGVAEPLSDLPRPGLHFGLLGQVDVGLGGDGDRERLGESDVCRAVVTRHRDAAGPRLVPEQTAHRSGEVPRVGNALEADDVGSEQTFEHQPSPRKLRVQAVCGERYVVEIADREIGTHLAQHLRNELQLVILHPHGAAFCDGVRRRFGESPIHPHVCVPPHASIAWGGDDVVVERPDGVVGEALVVLLDLVRTEGDRDEAGAVEVERLDVEISLPRPSDPGAVGLLHHRLQSGDEAPRRAAPAVFPFTRPGIVHGQTVGDDDEFGLGHRGS